MIDFLRQPFSACLRGLAIVLLMYFTGATGAEVDAGAELYRTHCAGCHGAQLQGASATALIKTRWQYGRSEFSLETNIRNGIPGTDMPAFRGQLGDKNIASLIAFLYRAQTTPLDKPEPLPTTIETLAYELQSERLVTSGIDGPWGIEFVSGDLALITDNTGKLFWLRDGRLDPDPITGLPAVDVATSTGGLLDLALDPAFENNGWVYLALSHSEDPTDRYAKGMTRVIRGRVDGNRWVDTEYLFRLDDRYHLPDSKHWGGRLLFDKDGYLYFSIGDMSVPKNSQDLALPSGKVFRINRDGSIPEDNPFVGHRDALQATFTFGNRNVQGLAQHPESGTIWATEHGPRGGDELNRLIAGHNYGWPVVTFGINYDGSTISDRTQAEGIDAPVRQWTPAPAVSAIEFVDGDRFPRWRNHLLVGTLAHEELWRLEISNEKIVAEELLFKGFGRIRDIKMAPDGSIYLLLNLPHEIVRLRPAG